LEADYFQDEEQNGDREALAVEMRRFFTILSICVYTAAIFMAGMLVVQLYALYVLVYTGAVFMIGIYIGQRTERSWELRREALAVQELKEDVVSREKEDVVSRDEVTKIAEHR
jgi:hypothetical protein